MGYDEYSTEELIQEKEQLKTELATIEKRINYLNKNHYVDKEKERKNTLRSELRLIVIHSVYVFFFFCAIRGQTPTQYCYDVFTDGNNILSAIVSVFIVLALLLIGGFFLFSLMNFIFSSEFGRKRNFYDFVVEPYNKEMNLLVEKKNDIENLIQTINAEEQNRENQKQ